MKTTIVAALITMILGVGGWYYVTQIHSTEIGQVMSNPRNFAGKEIAISGTVTERFSLVFIKYFILSDPTGNFTVVTDKPLPAMGEKIRVKGHVTEGFSLGDQQMLVFIESP